MLRIALAQVNATVGDLDGNAGLIVEWTRRAAARGVRVVVFPEMMLTGYPVEDLALRASFVEASIAGLHAVAARLAAEGLGGIAVVTGYLDRRADLAPRTGLQAGAPLDAAALAARRARRDHLAPSTTCRTTGCSTSSATSCPVTRCRCSGCPRIAARRSRSPSRYARTCGRTAGRSRSAGARARALLVVPNASPYERGKDDVRLDLCVRRARRRAPRWLTANMTGGPDELVFDGDSILVAADGALLARGPQFEEALVVADLDLPAAPPESRGDQPVDAGDGTVITIRRVTLPPSARSGPPGGWKRRRALPRSSGRRDPGRSGRGCPTRPRCTRRW